MPKRIIASIKDIVVVIYHNNYKYVLITAIMLEENLSKLGFSPSEIKVYVHLLKSGASYPNRISSETKINRTNVYEALDRLVAKGIVSFIIKNNIKWFEANIPERILSLIEKDEEILRNTKEDIIRDIKRIISSQKKHLEANIFVGKKGLRMIFEEILELKKPISLIASELQFKDLFGSYFELWHKKRIEFKIYQRSIFSERFEGKVENRKYLKYRFSDDEFINPTTTIIYGDNCVFIQWSEEPIAIKMENMQIAKSHQNYFEVLWKTATNSRR
jgi:sugar-specific transcriptional regulator TrmB